MMNAFTVSPRLLKSIKGGNIPYPVVMLFINSLASCWCLGVTFRLGAGVDVATSGSASEARETCVRIGGMLFCCLFLSWITQSEQNFVDVTNGADWETHTKGWGLWNPLSQKGNPLSPTNCCSLVLDLSTVGIFNVGKNCSWLMGWFLSHLSGSIRILALHH